MDQTGSQRIKQFAAKYSYVILVLGLGIFLMLLPNAGKSEPQADPSAVISNSEQIFLQEQLSELLSQMDGAGKVRVLLTEATGAKTEYQTNSNTSGDDRSSSMRTDTVILTDSSRNQTGLIRKVDPPTYLGAVVLCQGAEKPSIRLAITEAVSNATGLGYNRITILKMK